MRTLARRVPFVRLDHTISQSNDSFRAGCNFVFVRDHDNGPQFIAKDFKAFVRFSGMTHVTTSPYYPQSNGKLERFHGTIKKECIRPTCPRNYEEATRQISGYVKHYNEVRLHSAIGYITPADCLCGLANEIHAERDRKLEEARARRQAKSKDASLAIAS